MRDFLAAVRRGLGFCVSCITAIAVMLGLFVAGERVYAQLQQSGGPGSSVTLLAGSAIAGKVGIDQTTPGTTNLVAAGQNGTWTVQPGNTANTTAWFVKSVPATTCGTTAVSQAILAVPTASTAVFTSTTCLMAVFFENSNAGAQTVTLTDNAGTPLNAVGPAFSIPGLSNMVVPLWGIPFTSGVKWLAGGTGVLGGMAGYQ